jgi:hypothetical protein
MLLLYLLYFTMERLRSPEIAVHRVVSLSPHGLNTTFPCLITEREGFQGR